MSSIKSPTSVFLFKSLVNSAVDNFFKSWPSALTVSKSTTNSETLYPLFSHLNVYVLLPLSLSLSRGQANWRSSKNLKLVVEFVIFALKVNFFGVIPKILVIT